jgi:hypothetical protein
VYVFSGQAQQADIHWAVLGHEIDLHIEKAHNLFVHSYIEEFFIYTFPKSLSPTGVLRSDPKMKFCDHGCASCLLSELSQEPETVLISAVIEIGLLFRR